MIILLAGGVPALSMWDSNAIISGAVAGIIVALVLMILWGAVCHWVKEATDYWVRVRRRWEA
jgi:hypothetical protein